MYATVNGIQWFLWRFSDLSLLMETSIQILSYFVFLRFIDEMKSDNDSREVVLRKRFFIMLLLGVLNATNIQNCKK